MSTSMKAAKPLSAPSKPGAGIYRNQRNNLMNHQPSRMRQARRCRARSKRSGKPCQSPAVRGWAVCRMHGAGGGAPKGNRNAFKHGRYTAKALAERRLLRELLRETKDLLGKI